MLLKFPPLLLTNWVPIPLVTDHFGAVRVVGKLAWTHLPSNTAFRGVGVPQSALICEDMIEAVAAAVGRPAHTVRLINLMSESRRTPYGQLVSPCHTPRVIAELVASADYEHRRAAVDAFNRTSTWQKRGLALIPTV